MKKSSFWNFCFSLVPGCGQLYLGSTKKGVILLTSFFGTIAISAILRLEFLLFILPIIWFYAFFDAMNSRLLSQEQLDANDKDFSDKVSSLFAGKSIGAKRHVVFGILLIVLGGYLLLDNFMPTRLLEIAWIAEIFYKLPTLIVCGAIIALGVFLLKGKKQAPDFVEYKGGKEDGKQ